MNKWIKFPLIFGIIGGVLGIFFHPINIWRKIFPVSASASSGIGNLENITQIFQWTTIIDGLIIGIFIGLIIATFKKKKQFYPINPFSPPEQIRRT